MLMIKRSVKIVPRHRDRSSCANRNTKTPATQEVQDNSSSSSSAVSDRLVLRAPLGHRVDPVGNVLPPPFPAPDTPVSLVFWTTAPTNPVLDAPDNFRLCLLVSLLFWTTTFISGPDFNGLVFSSSCPSSIGSDRVFFTGAS